MFSNQNPHDNKDLATSPLPRIRILDNFFHQYMVKNHEKIKKKIGKLLRIIENKAHFNNTSWKHSKFTIKMSRFAPEIHQVCRPWSTQDKKPRKK